jgi:hypothetical protein
LSNRYHISPRTGLPNICRAKSANSCPIVGADGDHFGSKEEAREYIEENLSKEHGIKSISKKAKKPKADETVEKPVIAPVKPKPLSDVEAFEKLSKAEQRELVRSGHGELDYYEGVDADNMMEKLRQYTPTHLGRDTFVKRYKTASAMDDLDAMAKSMEDMASTLQKYYAKVNFTADRGTRSRAAGYVGLYPQVMKAIEPLKKSAASKRLLDEYNKIEPSNTLETAITLPDLKGFATKVGEWYTRRRYGDSE